MEARTKRTYNLSGEAIARVRELAGRYGAAPSQDGVVELAIDKLYREVIDREETMSWAQAAEDVDFVEEMRDVHAIFEEREGWPRR
jgi:hypothetical protein